MVGHKFRREAEHTSKSPKGNPDDPLSYLAEIFALYSFQSLPVVEDGKFIGLVRRRDLVHYVLRTGEELTDPQTELMAPHVPMT